MIKFVGLLLVVVLAVPLAMIAGGSGFLPVVLLAALVGVFAIIVTFINEIRRVLH